MEGYETERFNVKQDCYKEKDKKNNIVSAEIGIAHSAMNEFIEAVKWHDECVQLAKRMSPCSREAEGEIGLLTFCALEELKKTRNRLKLLFNLD